MRGRLWRRSNPALPEAERSQLVEQLMTARREIHRASLAGETSCVKAARAAKHALGERGAVWWTDGSPDFNRHLVRNSPYARWYAALSPPADAGAS